MTSAKNMFAYVTIITIIILHILLRNSNNYIMLYSWGLNLEEETLFFGQD